MGEEGVRDRANLTRSGEADERAAKARQPRPVDVGRRVDFALVAADERQRVAGARVGHGHASVGEAADRRRNAGNDLERYALLVQEQRLFAAAVEHERVSPLQPHDRPTLARLFGQQKADGVLIERFRRRRSDVDQLGARLREAQQAAVHAMVEDDDVGRLEATLAAHAHERGVTGAGTDDVDTRSIHGSTLDAVALSRANVPYRLSSSRSPRPVRVERVGESPAEPPGSAAGPLIDCRDGADPIERRDDGHQVEHAVVLAGKGAERQLTPAA